jgi:hypothetical protein
MEPAKRHQYIWALLGAGTLFLVGTIVVIQHAGVTTAGGGGAINIIGYIQPTNTALPLPVTPQPVRPTGINVPIKNNISTSTKTTDTSQTQTQPDSPFDWKSFVAILTHAPKPGATSTGSGAISDVYSFIPSGLISLPEPQSTITMPASQKPLYSWGQDAGTAIQSFEESHPNQPQVLTDFINDRQSASKIAAMKQLGADLSGVGDLISTIDPVPSQMNTAGPALANAYHEIGRNLAAIPDAKGDDATVKAILTYDKSAEAFVQKFVNVVNIFQANGVKYSQDEPGGVFMFPNQ